MKNGGDGHTLAATCLVSSRLVSTRAAGIASFVVCDNNFYDVHWLSDTDDIADCDERKTPSR